VTRKENARRGLCGAKARARTHCPAGHPYDARNTKHYRGYRYCRACRNAWNKAYIKRKRTAALLIPLSL
jgi:hypothetical protein